MEAIILAGGFGTRLRSVVSDVPKPMAPIDSKPFLEYLFHYLKKYNVTKVVLSVCHKKELIQKHFQNSFLDIEIDYSIEDDALGTGGAIKQSLSMCKKDNVVVLNGDSFFDINLNKLLEKHIEYASDLTLGLKPMENFDRYGVVSTDDNGKVTGFLEKKQTDNGNINGGVYIIKRSLLDSVEAKIFSFEEYMSNKYEAKNFFTMKSDGYFIDIGIPEDYEKAQRELKNVI
ncbi:nucleotidyltransferase family protein [Aliarcobacter butzleri]|uniref:nucleotidyltransferase family protein n=1 Tax=Aliarcobacter butzleri TaxID=28197 RepID=UPI0024DEF805|nr:nucleotidyltransferase family protein [Aliarcobacter butzleri]MDK2084126.1 nucleotidyltransferase family protein [Aliarcobacter butzleri]